MVQTLKVGAGDPGDLDLVPVLDALEHDASCRLVER